MSLNIALITLYFVIILYFTYTGFQAQKKRRSPLSGKQDRYYNAKGVVSSLAISLSLFATIFSSITFLGVPGEIITFGLSFLATIPAYLFTAWVINRFLVKRLYESDVDHLYQLVGKKYGIATQRLAVVYYFMLRVSWMAILIYMSGKSVCVVFDIDLQYSLSLSIGLAIVAIVYATVGGLVTVIKTDTLQGIVMFLSIIILSGFVLVTLGPLQYIESMHFTHWVDTPIVSFDPESRHSFLGRFLMSVCWILSLYLGDQVAFQRIRSSKSLKEAKKAIWRKLTLASAMVLVLTSAAISLMVYYQANPGLIPEANWFAAKGDLVLPHFIGLDLMPGLAGLVLIGLLSASMSSVDSAINGFASILSDGETFPVLSKLPRMQLSFGIGIFVLCWVTLIPFLQGSILEVAGRLTLQFHVYVAAFLFAYYFLPNIRAISLQIGIPIASILSICMTYSKEVFNLDIALIGYEWTTLVGICITLASILTVDFLRQLAIPQKDLEKAQASN